jgi:hypothetical protein
VKPASKGGLTGANGAAPPCWSSGPATNSSRSQRVTSSTRSGAARCGFICPTDLTVHPAVVHPASRRAGAPRIHAAEHRRSNRRPASLAISAMSSRSAMVSARSNPDGARTTAAESRLPPSGPAAGAARDSIALSHRARGEPPRTASVGVAPPSGRPASSAMSGEVPSRQRRACLGRKRVEDFSAPWRRRPPRAGDGSLAKSASATARPAGEDGQRAPPHPATRCHVGKRRWLCLARSQHNDRRGWRFAAPAKGAARRRTPGNVMGGVNYRRRGGCLGCSPGPSGRGVELLEQLLEQRERRDPALTEPEQGAFPDRCWDWCGPPG